MEYRNILVTGGCGFIGSNFLNYMVSEYPEVDFINVDCLNYCSNVKNITVSHLKNYYFYKLDIGEMNNMYEILIQHNVDCIVHFAAQSHVDTSFSRPDLFTKDNVVAHANLLETCRKYNRLKMFVYISTDEIYGESIFDHEIKTEESLPCPTNPYSASKIAAEMYVNAYRHSFGLPTMIIRSNNVYGPGQYIEKLIPKFITLLMNNKKCTIHGDGHYKRSFLHAYDFARALDIILHRGQIHNIYNIGSKDEYSVLQVTEILKELICPEKNIWDCVEFVKDRVFNDTRYLVDCSKLENLGWKQIVNFRDGILDTINSYSNIKELDELVTKMSME